MPSVTNKIYASLKSKGWLQRIAEVSLLRVLHRRFIGMNYFRHKIKMMKKWSKQRTEDDNFYYELTESNFKQLASMVAFVSGHPVNEIYDFINELRYDPEIRRHISSSWADDSKMADATVGFGRRYGWYAFIRAMKPLVVVETGVHQGVGSIVICSALMRNSNEGFTGKYIGTDINPNAGSLLTGNYANFGTILYGDSISSLKSLNENIDIFINDSDHSAVYEAKEYETVKDKLSTRSLILGDNSHSTDSLVDFAVSHNRQFLFFDEQPLDHWYPGAGIGISPTSIY